jgi:hypothetical protein
LGKRIFEFEFKFPPPTPSLTKLTKMAGKDTSTLVLFDVDGTLTVSSEIRTTHRHASPLSVPNRRDLIRYAQISPHLVIATELRFKVPRKVITETMKATIAALREKVTVRFADLCSLETTTTLMCPARV